MINNWECCCELCLTIGSLSISNKLHLFLKLLIYSMYKCQIPKVDQAFSLENL